MTQRNNGACQRNMVITWQQKQNLKLHEFNLLEILFHMARANNSTFSHPYSYKLKSSLTYRLLEILYEDSSASFHHLIFVLNLLCTLV